MSLRLIRLLIKPSEIRVATPVSVSDQRSGFLVSPIVDGMFREKIFLPSA